MRTPLLATCNTAITVSTQRYLPPFGVDVSSGTEFAYFSWIAPCAGTLSLFSVQCDAGPGAGLTRTFTVRKNGADTALTVTFSGAATSPLQSDQVHSITVAAGDLITYGTTASGATTSTGNIVSSMVFDGTTEGQSVLAGSGSNTSLSTSAVNYLSAFQSRGADTVAANVQQVVAHGGTVKNAQVKLSAAPGAGKTRTFTLVKNGVDTAIVVSITGASTTTGTDLTHSASIAAGDLLYWRSDVTTTPAAATVALSLEYDPTTNGTSIIGYGTSNAPSTTLTRYQNPVSGDGTYQSTAAPKQVLAPVAFKIVSESVVVGTAPGAGATWQMGSVQNGTATWENGVTGTAATGVNAMFPGGIHSFAANDLFAAYTFPSSSPVAPGTITHGFAIFIPPNTGAAQGVGRLAVTVGSTITARAQGVGQATVDPAGMTVITIQTYAAQGVGRCSATATLIDNDSAVMIGVGRMTCRAAIWVPTPPVIKVGQESGLPNPYNAQIPTSPYYPLFNRTWDYDMDAGDLGLSYDVLDGTFRTAFGDSFGSDWIGPFTAGQANAGSTLAASNGGIDLATLTHASPGTLTMNTSTGPTGAGFAAISTPGFGPGAYSTIYFTSRSGATLNGVELLTGGGVLSSSGTQVIRFNDPRTGGGWRSITLAKSSDGDLHDGYVFSDFAKNAGGVAKDISLSTHDTAVFTDGFPDAGLPISQFSETGWVVTVTFTSPHTFTKPGEQGWVTGTGTRWDGSGFRVATIPDSTHITFFDQGFGADIATVFTGVLYRARAAHADHRLLPDGTRNPTGGFAIANYNGSGVTRQFVAYMQYFGLSGVTGAGTFPCIVSYVYSDDDWATSHDASASGGDNFYFQSLEDNFAGLATMGQFVLAPDGYLYCIASEVIIGDITWSLGATLTPRAWAVRVKPTTDVLDATKYEWWDGSKYVANGQASAANLERNNGGSTDGLIGPSLYYSAANKLWVVSNASFWEGGLMMRTAMRPEGPWSTKQRLLDPAIWFPSDISYGGWMHPWSERAPQLAGDLYFHVSGAQAYSPFGFKTSLGPVSVVGAAQGVGRGAVTNVALAIDVGSASTQGVGQVTVDPAGITRVANIGAAAALGVGQVTAFAIKIADVGTAAVRGLGVVTAAGAGRLVDAGLASFIGNGQAAVDPAGISRILAAVGSTIGVGQTGLSSWRIIVGPASSQGGLITTADVLLIAHVSGSAVGVGIGAGNATRFRNLGGAILGVAFLAAVATRKDTPPDLNRVHTAVVYDGKTSTRESG